LEKRLQIQKVVNLNLNRPLAVGQIRSPAQMIMTTGMEEARTLLLVKKMVARMKMRMAS
jgi:predicted type IV restriction endonuclease